MEENEIRDLPPEFNDWVRGKKVALCWANIARTYSLQDGHGRKTFLKIQAAGSMESAEMQARKLMWLQGKIPVPQVLDYGRIGEHEFLLTSEMIGIPASGPCFQDDAEQIVELAAKGLRSIHEIPIEHCPFDNRLNRLLETIRSNLENGKINHLKLKDRFGIESADDLLHEVESYASEMEEDLVFSHGDYSMPNLLVAEGRITGFLDLGNCGVADRYYDLAVAEKSIVMNFGAEYIDLFYTNYGKTDIDREKIRFFQIIECLVWG